MPTNESGKDRPRIHNLRLSEKAKALLREIQAERRKKGVYQSLSQLCVEAMFLLHRHEFGERKTPQRSAAESAAADSKRTA